jgi:FMN phosphatase YigB (HAD superfamily)
MNKHTSRQTLVQSRPGDSRFNGSDANPSESFDAEGLVATNSVPTPFVREAAEWTLEYLLLGDLTDLLSEKYDEENRRWILVVLEGLLDAIPAEKRRERFSKLRAAYPDSPGMLQSLEQLEYEHDAMIYQLQRLRNRVAWRLSLLDVVAAEVVRDLKRWLVTFQNFCQREHRLENFEQADSER